MTEQAKLWLCWAAALRKIYEVPLDQKLCNTNKKQCKAMLQLQGNANWDYNRKPYFMGSLTINTKQTIFHFFRPGTAADSKAVQRSLSGPSRAPAPREGHARFWILAWPGRTFTIKRTENEALPRERERERKQAEV